MPLLTSVSTDQRTGVVTPVCPRHVAIKLAEVLKPMKVIFLNDYGGLVDDNGKVVQIFMINALPNVVSVELRIFGFFPQLEDTGLG